MARFGLDRPRTSRLRRTARAVVAGAVATLAWTIASTAALAQGAIRDTEIETVIRDWSRPIMEAQGLNVDDITLVLVSDDSLNAFASRGLIMGLNTGLIMRTQTPNQLLGVVAHEGAHLANRHVISDAPSNAAMGPMLMSMALGALAAAAGAPDAGVALAGSSQYFGTLGALEAMRHMEAEADNSGAKAMDRAGMSALGLVEFFDREIRREDLISGAALFPYFRSHPLTSDRVEKLRGLVRNLRNVNRKDPPEWIEQHAIIIAKMRGFMNAPASVFVNYPETDTSYPARYARTIAYYRMGQIDRANTDVDALLAEQPDNPYLWELKGQILFENGRMQEAVTAHQKSVDMLPDAPLLRINLGHALIEEGGAENLFEAILNLKRAVVEEPRNTMAWRLLARAHEARNEPGEARLATAEMYYAGGDSRQAVQSALSARPLLDRNSVAFRRAEDIILAGGATQQDLIELDRRNPLPGQGAN